MINPPATLTDCEREITEWQRVLDQYINQKSVALTRDGATFIQSQINYARARQRYWRDLAATLKTKSEEPHAN